MSLRLDRLAGVVTLATLAAVGCGCSRAPLGVALAGVPEPAPASRSRGAQVERLLSNWPARPRDAVTEYVERLGRELAQLAFRGPVEQKFHVLRGPALNAFSTPSKDIFVTEGMVAFCNTEDELAAILAHELAHFRAGHFEGRRHTMQAAAGSADGTGTAFRPLFELAAEEEADRISLAILTDAGFDPWAALELAHRISLRPAQGDHVRSWVQRVRSLRRALRDLPPPERRSADAFPRLRRMLRAELGLASDRDRGGEPGS